MLQISANVLNQMVTKIKDELESNVTNADEKSRLKSHLEITVADLKKSVEQLQEANSEKFAELTL